LLILVSAGIDDSIRTFMTFPSEIHLYKACATVSALLAARCDLNKPPA
jgi:hypothetical protein